MADSEDNVSSVIDDQEWTESCERAEIVLKYNQGVTSAEADENPTEEMYSHTDRYGFVHREGLPPPSEAQRRERMIEANRADKWLHMVGNWSKFKHSDKLGERVAKGIPDRLRSQVWRLLLETCVSEGGVTRPSYTAGMYDELKARALLCAKDVKQIDLDVNRSYRENVAFRQRYDHKQAQLLSVLAAYSVYNTDVGYCQGMSHVAALLLLYMDEEDAFWAFHALMTDRRHCMHGFFAHGFPKLMRFQEHLEKKLLKKYLPRVRKHFDKENVPFIFTTKWYMGCFLDRIPYSLALRVWDMYILYGDSVLIAMSFNIIKMHQKTLRKVPFEEVLDILQNRLAIDFGYDDDAVIASLRKCMEQLRADKKLFPAPNMDTTANEKPRTPFGTHILQRSVADIRRDEIRIQSRHTSRAQSMSNYTMNTTPTHAQNRQEKFAQSVTRRLAKVTPASTSEWISEKRRENQTSPVSWSQVDVRLTSRKDSDYDNVDDNPDGHAFLQSSNQRMPQIPPPDYDSAYIRHCQVVTQHADHVTTVRISPTLDDGRAEWRGKYRQARPHRNTPV